MLPWWTIKQIKLMFFYDITYSYATKCLCSQTEISGEKTPAHLKC